MLPAVAQAYLLPPLAFVQSFLFSLLADLNSASSHSGVDLKNIILTVLVLGVIGVIAWFVSTKPVPWWLQTCIYIVLGIAAIVVVFRFVQNM